MNASGGSGDETAPNISERDVEVVRAIEGEGLSTFTFDGLRRLTGTHPETLSRSLDRLEEEGMIVRSSDGYSMTERAKGVAGLRSASRGEKRIRILHTFLPYGASLASIVSALRGRWFDRMRWVGMAEMEDGVVLKWLAEDGSALIDAKLFAGQLEVEARVRREEDVAGAVRAAHQLMARITRLYANPRQPGRPLMLRIGYFKPYAM